MRLESRSILQDAPVGGPAVETETCHRREVLLSTASDAYLRGGHGIDFDK